MRTIDETEAQQAAPRHDTELTLGSGTLLLMFFGLVLLCGLCFGVGYSMGHRGIQDGSEAANFAANAAAFLHGKTTPNKPTTSTPAAPARVQESLVQSTAHLNTSQAPAEVHPQAAIPVAEPPAHSVAAPSPEPAAQAPTVTRAASSVPAAQPAVKLAVAKLAPVAIAKPSPPANAKSEAAANARQASAAAKQAAAPAKPAPPQGPVMVQIAAVSLDEDADVLVAALRKRNYAVASNRDALDGLIHVRIGPFKTRDEADTWREKLLNDGYNAIIQP